MCFVCHVFLGIEQCWFCSDESVCTCLPSICLNLFPIITLVCWTWWLSTLLGLTLYILFFFFLLPKIILIWFDMIWICLCICPNLFGVIFLDFHWHWFSLSQTRLKELFVQKFSFFKSEMKKYYFSGEQGCGMQW